MRERQSHISEVHMEWETLLQTFLENKICYYRWQKGHEVAKKENCTLNNRRVDYEL